VNIAMANISTIMGRMTETTQWKKTACVMDQNCSQYNVH